MTAASDRTLMRLGGVGALAAMLLSALRVLGQVTAFQELYNPSYGLGITAFAEYWSLAAVEACATALAVLGAWELMTPRNRVLRAGALAGAAAAAMLLAGSLLSIPMRYAGPPRWEEFSCVPLGVWMLCLVSADWRLRRLPAWLRVVGAVLGAVLMVLPALLVLRLLTIMGLAWWTGLGVVLLRARPADSGRSTSG